MTTTIHSNNESNIDFDKEGQKLLARVHLEANENDTKRWRKLNAKTTLVYRDPHTGGTIHVGNAVAARSLDLLNAMSPAPCRKIVCCQGSSKLEEQIFRNSPDFEYFHFPVAQWKRTVGYDRCHDPSAILEYFQPLFDFLDHELAAGNAVLIHCLAGAHRAGACGIATLMYLTGMNAKEATLTAQSLRPIINPIGDFPTLLKLLEEGLESRRENKQKQ